MIPDAVLDERREDGDDVLTLLCQAVVDLAVVQGIGHSLDDSLPLKVSKSDREGPWGQARVLPQDLAECRVAREGDVAQDDQCPFPAQAAEVQARADRARLEGNQRTDGL